VKHKLQLDEQIILEYTKLIIKVRTEMQHKTRSESRNDGPCRHYLHEKARNEIMPRSSGRDQHGFLARNHLITPRPHDVPKPQIQTRQVVIHGFPHVETPAYRSGFSPPGRSRRSPSGAGIRRLRGGYEGGNCDVSGCGSCTLSARHLTMGRSLERL
jgi:hypothetical protein